ncbi:hypothetical protein KAR91_00875, partial [Candidatus Pacearchaeota archaeon]|nr:hypothetical protein [Candidatus Pacearchaeota archaeon]
IIYDLSGILHLFLSCFYSISKGAYTVCLILFALVAFSSLRKKIIASPSHPTKLQCYTLFTNKLRRLKREKAQPAPIY